MEDEKVEESYKKLQEVERVFRDLIFLCLLSQVILARVRKRLKEGG